MSHEKREIQHACVIWMHGLGADAADMSSLAAELELEEFAVRHLAISAPLRSVTINNGMCMPAWYDIYGFGAGVREDKQGILDSQARIQQIIQEQIAAGFEASQIFLAGFSQGGAMALHAALATDLPLGGVISLSAYLPLATECKAKLPRTTPFFLGYGRQDMVVLPAWTEQSLSYLKAAGYDDCLCYDYSMGHSICLEEVNHLSGWFLTQLRRNKG